MRLRHIDAEDSTALAARAALLDRARALWEEIAQLGKIEGRVAALKSSLQTHLSAIDPELEWELSLDEAQAELLLATGGDPRLRTLIEVLIEQVTPADGWSWRAGRSAQPFERAIRCVAKRTGVDLEHARVRVGFVRAHLLEVLVQASAFGGSRDAAAERASYLAVEQLLGERLMERWVGQVVVAPLPRGGLLSAYEPAKTQTSTLPLVDLLPTVSHATEALYAGLPAEPCHARERGGDWTMLEAEPPPSSDWAAQDDLVVATTMLPEMLRSFLCEPRFWSGRFSPHGESFCYLKIDRLSLAREERLALRAALEDALDAALAASALGAVVGNGFGVRYDYVVLALHRTPAALLAAREVCRAAGLPRRSWILFCDAELEAEWLPIWPDAGAPPAQTG